jgi:hypothetical protein
MLLAIVKKVNEEYDFKKKVREHFCVDVKRICGLQVQTVFVCIERMVPLLCPLLLIACLYSPLCFVSAIPMSDFPSHTQCYLSIFRTAPAEKIS